MLLKCLVAADGEAVEGAGFFVEEHLPLTHIIGVHQLLDMGRQVAIGYIQKCLQFGEGKLGFVLQQDAQPKAGAMLQKLVESL